VAQLYPRALGSLYVASYDSQGYGGGILTREVEVEVTLRLTVSHSVSLGVEHPCGTCDQISRGVELESPFTCLRTGCAGPRSEMASLRSCRAGIRHADHVAPSILKMSY
jgi:hypothetical protein